MTLRWIVIALLLSASPLQAEVSLSEGAQKYQTCAGCHGPKAEGIEALRAPALSHLQPVYIVRQLQNYVAGVRSGSPSSPAGQMAAAVAGWEDIQDKRSLAVYIASLDSVSKPQTLAGNAAAGERAFLSLCAGCHGRDAKGKNVLHAPALAGANDWYLLAKMKAFQSGERGSHPSDGLGVQMQSMASLLDDQKLLDVIAYITAQPQ